MEKAVEAGRHYDPEQKEFVLGILKFMPGVLGNEDRCTFFERMTHTVENKYSAAIENIEDLIHLEVPMDGNARSLHDLLGSQGEIGRACSGAEFNEDVALVTKMNQMLPLGCVEHIPLRLGGLGRGDGFRQDLAEAKSPEDEETGSALLLESVHAFSSAVRVIGRQIDSG
jgi:hypothetical protein